MTSEHAKQTIISMACETLAKRVTRHAAEVFTKEMLAETPGTVQYLNRKMQQREESKQRQDATADALKRERSTWLKILVENRQPITWTKRRELAGYLPDHDLLWPEHCPILSLEMKA